MISRVYVYIVICDCVLMRFIVQEQKDAATEKEHKRIAAVSDGWYVIVT